MSEGINPGPADVTSGSTEQDQLEQSEQTPEDEHAEIRRKIDKFLSENCTVRPSEPGAPVYTIKEDGAVAVRAIIDVNIPYIRGGETIPTEIVSVNQIFTTDIDYFCASNLQSVYNLSCRRVEKVDLDSLTIVRRDLDLRDSISINAPDLKIVEGSLYIQAIDLSKSSFRSLSAVRKWIRVCAKTGKYSWSSSHWVILAESGSKVRGFNEMEIDSEELKSQIIKILVGDRLEADDRSLSRAAAPDPDYTRGLSPIDYPGDSNIPGSRADVE